MTNSHDYANALEQFRSVLARLDDRKGIKGIIAKKDEVLARYHSAFQYENILNLPEETFRSFLYFENNNHWTGLYRQGLGLCRNLNELRKALELLLNPSRPIDERFHKAIASLNGLGKGISTAILLVSDPEQYGVWNNTSEAALKILDIWPDFPRGANNGKRYEILNQFLHHLASDLGIDLWTLDALMWGISPSDEEEAKEAQAAPTANTATPYELGFSLERHLHNFLFDNWDQMALGKDWALYGDEGDDEPGYEYPTGVGRIDLLAHHRTKPEWLVIELKKDRTSDAALGQLLRYIGWVKNQLAQPGDVIRGLIIARDADEALRYAISALPNADISLLSYEVDFHLKQIPLKFNPAKK